MRAVHLLRFNDAGEITYIDLIARPAKGVMALDNRVAAKAAPQIKAARGPKKHSPLVDRIS
jgi:hypothetical protein